MSLTEKIQKLKENVSCNSFDTSFLTHYFEQKCTYFKAGGTAQRFSAWRSLTSDKTILDAIRGITIPLDELPKQHKFNTNPKFSQAETIAVNYEMERLLAKEVIELVTRGNNLSDFCQKEKRWQIPSHSKLKRV